MGNQTGSTIQRRSKRGIFKPQALRAAKKKVASIEEKTGSVAESVDAPDLKSVDLESWGFKSPPLLLNNQNADTYGNL